MTKETEKNKKINWAIIVSIIGIVLTGIYKFYPVEAELKYNVLANANVLDLKADVAKLSISYDSIDLIKSKQSISLVIIEIRNDGNKDIRLDDYDQTTDFGIEINDGIILNKPTINSSSDNKYFRDIIKDFENNKIKFRYKLLDRDQFFTLKFLILHSSKVSPTISPLGKVSGMKKIEVTNSVESNAELVALKEKNRILLYVFVVSFIVVVLLLIVKIQRDRNRELLLRMSDTNGKSSSDKLIQLSLDEMVELKEGDLIFHERFGQGVVISIEKRKKIDESRGTFVFVSSGEKILFLRFAPLYKFEE